MSVDLSTFEQVDTNTLNNLDTIDEKTIKALAKENQDKYVALQQNLRRWIGFYTLQHRISHNTYKEDPLWTRYSCIKNGNFHTKVSQDIPLTNTYIIDDLSKKEKTFSQFPKYLKDNNDNDLQGQYILEADTDVVKVSEQDLLGHYHSWHNVRNGAVLTGSFLTTPIFYQGYTTVFDQSHPRKDSESGEPYHHTVPKIGYPCPIKAISNTEEEIVFFTIDGLPLSSNNWVIAYVEMGQAYADKSDSQTQDKLRSYTRATQEGKAPLLNMQIYINLFLPDGGLVRSVIERTGRYIYVTDGREETSIPDYNVWVYKDYANAAAGNRNFSTIWNQICRGDYQMHGKPRTINFEEKIDNTCFLFYWDTGLIQDQERTDDNKKIKAYAYEDIKNLIGTAAAYNGKNYWSGKAR